MDFRFQSTKNETEGKCNRHMACSDPEQVLYFLVSSVLCACFCEFPGQQKDLVADNDYWVINPCSVANSWIFLLLVRRSNMPQVKRM